MRLKKLVLDGFKSFGHKTEFDFEPGITAVVGPNGCGKSNVVDAFRWVLGVSSAKAIRGQEMTDMIFDGGAINRPAPHAHVRLLFDNSDGFFRRSDADEVEIGRKLSRDGKSEYFLNGEICRKRDLRALFADTGIGIEAYSVIEQGKIDLLLRHDPQERRKIFEEAAGINQYKDQRRQAELRLERAERNLTRLGDIMEELKSQIRRVRSQAGKARRYREYTSELHLLRVERAVREYRQLRDARENLLRQAASIARELEQMEAVHERAKEDLAEAESEQEAVQEELGQLLQRLHAIEVELREHETKLHAHEERLAEIDDLRRRRDDIERINAGRRESLRSQRESHTGAIADIEAEMAGEQDAFAALEAEVGEMLAEIQEREERYAAKRKEVEELERRRDALVRSHGTLEGDVRIARHDLVRLERERDEIDEQAQSAEADAAELAAALVDAQAQLAEFSAQRDECRATLRAKRAELEAMRAERAQTAEQAASLRARQSTLQEMLDSHEGLTSGTTHLLDDADLREKVRVQGTVMDLLEPTKPYAAIAEAILGPLGQAVVVPEPKDAFAALDELAAAEKGGALLLTLSTLPRAGEAAKLPAAGTLGGGKLGKGIVGWLHELVVPAAGAKHAASSRLIDGLLHGVLVVRTLKAARAVLADLPRDASVATLDGQLVRPPGWFSGKPEAAGLITVRSQLAELDEALGRAQDASAEAAAAVEGLQGACADAESGLAEADEAVSRLTLEVREIESQQKHGAQARQQAQERRATAERQCDELAEQVDDGTERLAEVAATLREVEQQLAAITDSGEEGPTLSELRRAYDERHRELSDARIKRAEWSHRLESNRQQLAHIDETLRNLDAEEERLAAETVRAASQEAESRQIVEVAGREVERLRAEGESFATSREDLERRQAVARQRVAGARHNVDESASRCETLRSSLLEARTREESCVERMNDLEQRAQQELELDLADELERAEREAADTEVAADFADEAPADANADTAAAADVDEEADDEPSTESNVASPDALRRQIRAWADEAVRARIEELNEKVRKLGPVNMAALEELDELEEKKAFLDKQNDDLLAARNEIRRIVQDIDRRTKAMFLGTFEQIRENFQKLFRKLFNGGGADVYLLDPEEPLTSGIEIKARPPGNEPRTLTLLSGGQRSMIAIAMIFAVFQTKPSPFCILDEVDAALDDANKQRFAGLVREFAHSTQFLVITHSKATMAAADLMYGITMQERGVSKRIHVRFEQIEETEDGDVEFHDLDDADASYDALEYPTRAAEEDAA